MSFRFPLNYQQLLCLLLCFFLHACNSRPLALLNKESSQKDVLLGFSTTEDGGKERLENTLIPRKHWRRFVYLELQPEEIHTVKLRGKSTSPESLVGANAMKLKASDNLEEENINEGIDHNRVSSSIDVLQGEAKIKGSKIPTRSTMESKKQDDTNEKVKSEENDIVEDVVVMDYAQPHRKPPIHNLEP